MSPIADMHCDLLLYLSQNSGRTALNPEVRCSLPQLRAGNVKLQTMAVFTLTEKGSTLKAQNQLEHFAQLPQKYPEDFYIVKKNDPLEPIFPTHAIKILLAIENASGLFEEDEPLENGFQRIQSIENNVGKISYISLTWNLENRLGGGAHTTIGLKEDGRKVIDFLHQKKIALDLSHTSDHLAYDILNYVEKKDLKIPIIASHSNFRTIRHVPRNLPDEIAKEIIRRKGVIGFVLYRDFVGAESPLDFIRQCEYLLKLNGASHGCFGADFFCGTDLPPAFQKPLDKLFFVDFQDASVYQSILDLWKKNLGLSLEILEGIAYRNFLNFYECYINNPNES